MRTHKSIRLQKIDPLFWRFDSSFCVPCRGTRRRDRGIHLPSTTSTKALPLRNYHKSNLCSSPACGRIRPERIPSKISDSGLQPRKGKTVRSAETSGGSRPWGAAPGSTLASAASRLASPPSSPSAALLSPLPRAGWTMFVGIPAGRARVSVMSCGPAFR